MMKRLFLALFLLVGGPSVCLGEDIAIFGVEAPSTVKPNVLIIFDNSGSMDTDDVESNPYDPTQTYPGTYDSDRVYQMYIGAGRQIFWNNFASSTSIISCTPVREKLEDIGFETARIGYYSCGGMRRVLKTGNYLNYEATGSSVVDTRLNVAKAAVTEILTNTTDAYFGLMVFNYDPSLSPSQSEGGRLVVECGSTSTTQSDGTETIDNTAIINEVQGISAETWTPLAETLAEAGTYFAGGSSLFNTGVTYTSPITNYCQKNYVIIITDGEPKADHAPILYDPDTPYLNGKSISEYAGDTSDESAVTEPGSDNTASYYLDDVAALLKTEDLLPLMGDASTIETQNLVTFTIGFKTNQPLLQKTAERGGGLYYTANTASSLAAALDQIVRTIKEDATSFVAPVIPVNRANPTRSGGFIYLAFFKPKQNQEWIGNIKKYKLSENGSIYDANNTLATNPDHSLKESSLSFWTQTVPHDGGTIEAGGIGERIVAQTSRNLYTYQGSQNNLTHSSNRLAENNSISFNSQPIANQAIARAANGHNGWKVGAIIHSEPLVAHYSATQTAIFFGANDGFLHAIDDATGEELWAFVPPDQTTVGT